MLWNVTSNVTLLMVVELFSGILIFITRQPERCLVHIGDQRGSIDIGADVTGDILHIEAVRLIRHLVIIVVDLLIECCETEAVSRCRDTTCCEVYIVGAVKQVLFRCRVLMGCQTKCFCRGSQPGGSVRASQRSEEHTSELQSRG